MSRRIPPGRRRRASGEVHLQRSRTSGMCCDVVIAMLVLSYQPRDANALSPNVSWNNVPGGGGGAAAAVVAVAAAAGGW